VQAAGGLLNILAFQQGYAAPAGVAVAAMEPPSCSSDQGRRGGGSQQAASCAGCGAASRPDGRPLLLCSACRGASYCSGACQTRDWGEHKGACRRVACWPTD
jgi:hypothetical protein